MREPGCILTILVTEPVYTASDMDGPSYDVMSSLSCC